MIPALCMLCLITACSVGYAVYIACKRRAEQRRRERIIHMARMLKDAHDLD